MSLLRATRSSIPASVAAMSRSAVPLVISQVPLSERSDPDRPVFAGNGRNRSRASMQRRFASATPLEDTASASNAPTRQASPHQEQRSTNTNRNGPSNDDQIKHILTQVPIGRMNTQMVSFLHTNLSRLCILNTERAAAAAEQLLDRLAAEQDRNRASYLTGVPYTRVIRSWASTNNKNSIFHAHKVLEKMLARHDANPDCHPAPDTHTYLSFLYACSLSSHAQAVPMAEEAVRVVEAKSQESSDDSPPTAIADATLYNALILVHANRSHEQYGAANAAEDCLMRLSRLSATGGPGPNTLSFNLVLKAWTHSAEDNGADRALEILKLLCKLHTEEHHVQPDAISFGTVINGFTRRKRPVKADHVLQQALDYFCDSTKQTDLTSCFNATALAWAKSRDPKAPERAEALMRDAYKLANTPNSNIVIVPDIQLHMHCIKAHAKSESPNGIDRADQILRDMVYSFVNSNGPEPSVGAFDMVLHGWLRSKKPTSAEHAESLLRLMLDLAKRKGGLCQPATNHFVMCLMCWLKSSAPDATARAIVLLEKMEELRLVNFFCYTSLINRLCRTRNTEDALMAITILRRMEVFVAEHGFEKPSYVVGLYTAAISSLARVRTPQAAEMALQTLRGMPKTLSPTSRTYTGLVHAFAGLQGEKVATTIMELFEEIKELDADPTNKVSLDQVIFSSVLNCLAGSNSAAAGDQACRVLGVMLQLHESGREDIEPDSRCYDACLLALSHDPANLARAVNLLKTLVTKHDEKAVAHLPSRLGFQAVMRSSDPGRDAPQIAEIAKLMQRVAKGTRDIQ